MMINVSFEKTGAGAVTYWDEEFDTFEDAREAAEAAVDNGEADEAHVGDEIYTEGEWWS